MKVLFDYQALLFQKYGGVSRYHYELYKRLNQKSVEVSAHCWFNKNSYFEAVFNSTYRPIYSKIPAKQFFNQIYTVCDIKKHNYDIIHPTFYNPYIIGKGNGKLIVTIHDMIHELFFDTLQDSYTISNKKKMIQHADHIIAVSENTKKDILEFYPEIPEDKISVIYHGSSFIPNEVNKDMPGFPSKFILFVGNRFHYKNYAKFFEAIKPLLIEYEDLYLVSLGGGTFTKDEITMHGEMNKKVIHMDVDDDILNYAYSNAVCFVFPSLYEGFGIPVLEAFSCGCPVVLSNTSSLPEVGGDAVIYINPEETTSICNGVKSLLENEKFRQELVRRGAEQLVKFDWENTAEQTLECYKKVLR
ncbi:glycosyltransferase family 4 protein [Butyrivibrio sp. AE3006]|uniref:glycosyltransferase family 4 protein n=1 Tax=Butyrivibrio sp. AE3006 TaxID=1280673 RepID=UPI000425C397|nr:glycosyltransferase family 1 protein [Butyrivibrio sp. AE3006]